MYEVVKVKGSRMRLYACSATGKERGLASPRLNRIKKAFRPSGKSQQKRKDKLVDFQFANREQY
jgi:hypothetical protein